MSDVYILGAGAMGCLWASYLSADHPIHFISKHPSSSAFEFCYLPGHKIVTTSIKQATDIDEPISRLIVATKAYDAFSALETLKHCLSSDAQVVLLQNGLGSQQAIQQAYPDLRLYACSSTEGAYKQDQHTLVHAGKGINTIGALNSQSNIKDLSNWIPNSLFQWHDDIEQVLWRKFMINCAINPLTLIYQCANGQLVENKEYYAHMSKICAEIDMLTHKKGYHFPNSLALAQDVCKVTAQNFSSMYQDAQHGRPTEIDFMTGFLLKEAAKFGLNCPENQALFNHIVQL